MIAMKQFFWTNTENFLLLNVGHTTSPVRVAKRTETARGFWCMHKQTNSIYFFYFFFIKTVYETQIKQTRILSKFLISLSKMHTPPYKKKSSNLHGSQELSGPLPKKTNQSKY